MPLDILTYKIKMASKKRALSECSSVNSGSSENTGDDFSYEDSDNDPEYIYSNPDKEKQRREEIGVSKNCLWHNTFYCKKK